MPVGKFSLLFRLSLIASLCCLSACGGGSSDSGMLIEGRLTQGETGGHLESAQLRHGAGETIAEVAICALGECSTTDSNGQWGFVADESYKGGDIVFTITGHGIDGTRITAPIPLGASSVVINFVRGENDDVEIDSLVADGNSVVSSHDGAHNE